MTEESEVTYVLRFEPEVGRASEAALDALDDKLGEAGIGEVAGTMDLGGLDFVALVDLKAAYCLPQLEALLVEVGLAGKCSLEEAQDADEDDWGDDEDDWEDDEDDEDYEDDEDDEDDRSGEF